MDRQNFMYELNKELYVLPRIEIKQALQYYEEYFDDCLENGKNEFEVITSLGTPSNVAAQIIAASNVKEVNRQQTFEDAQKQPTIKNYKRSIGAMISAPIVLPLKFVLYIVWFVLIIVGFSLLVSFGAVSFSTFVSGVVVLIACIPGAIYFGSLILMVELLGAGLALLGVGLLFYLITLATFKGSIKISSKLFSCFGRRK